jgi:mannose-6-phosphate isomerase-like protein (cupin superfamily)
MKGYVVDIEKATKENENFRKVLYTAKSSQLVVMSLRQGEDIGEETHDLDQFIRIEKGKGKGKAILDGAEHMIEDDYAVVIPSGTRHKIVNKADAMADDEEFDGRTTE